MPQLRRLLPRGGLDVLRRIGSTAATKGTRAYLVGGGVRDVLLGNRTGDLDVVVEGALRDIARSLGGKLRTHPGFMTATVVLRNGCRIDLARSRIERYPSPAALPEVRPASLEQDLRRRDFTVNALAVTLAPADFGRVIDVVGGLADLDRRRLDVLHDDSFIEDPTRAFRGVGFAARLGFALGAGTARLLRTALAGGVADRLSAARLRREVERILGVGPLATTVRLMQRHGLLRVLHPELRTTPRVLARLERVGSVLVWYRKSVGEEEEQWVVSLGLILEILTTAQLRSTLERLQPDRRSRTVLKRAGDLAGLRRSLARMSSMRPSRIRDVCCPYPAAALLAAMTDPQGSRVHRAIATYLRRLRSIRPDISGDDIARAGIARGPRIRRGLDAALAAKLDGIATGPRAQLAAALRAAGRA